VHILDGRVVPAARHLVTKNDIRFLPSHRSSTPDVGDAHEPETESTGYRGGIVPTRGFECREKRRVRFRV
jgi:hypothetical protein